MELLSKNLLTIISSRKSTKRPVTKSTTGCSGGKCSNFFLPNFILFLFLFKTFFQLTLADLIVSQKFRTGGYNIIVATSIGEEGLDIMEVDLVICFDANISPLRMIQRMGRTGRKHDGRVDILLVINPVIK